MASLFPEDLPAGFRYEDAFLSRDEEAALLDHVRGITFANFEMRGVIARRPVAFFGAACDASRPTEPMPAFLDPLRARVIELAPRSAYLIAGEARRNYEPSVPPVDALRYSITFRTLR